MRNFILLTISAILLTSCARQINSDVYSVRQVGEVSATYPGIIRNIRQVCVEQSGQLEDHSLGIAGGGVAGGLIGNAIGKGHVIPTAAGAIAGAVAGSLIEKRAKQQIACEYIVELYQGGLITVVQDQNPFFNIGQPVYVMVSPYGRSRLIPQ